VQLPRGHDTAPVLIEREKHLGNMPKVSGKRERRNERDRRIRANETEEQRVNRNSRRRAADQADQFGRQMRNRRRREARRRRSAAAQERQKRLRVEQEAAARKERLDFRTISPEEFFEQYEWFRKNNLNLFEHFEDEPLLAVILWYLNSGYGCFCGVQKTDLEAIRKEIEDEMLTPEEMKKIIERFFRVRSFGGGALLSCGACGLRELMRDDQIAYYEKKLSDLPVGMCLNEADREVFEYNRHVTIEVPTAIAGVSKTIQLSKVFSWYESDNLFEASETGERKKVFYLHPELIHFAESSNNNDEDDSNDDDDDNSNGEDYNDNSNSNGEEGNINDRNGDDNDNHSNDNDDTSNDNDTNNEQHECTWLCGSCSKWLDKKEKRGENESWEPPPLSIAGGIDFGWSERLGLERPSLQEEAIIARARRYMQIVKMKPNEGSQTDFTLQKIQTHAILFEHDAPYIAKSCFDKDHIKKALSFIFVDPDGKLDSLTTATLHGLTVDGRSYVVYQWLAVVQQIHNFYKADYNYISLPDYETFSAAFDECMKEVSLI